DREAYRLRERILSGKMAVGERLIDHRDPWRRRRIPILNHSPAQQPDAERVERLPVNFIEIGDGLFSCFRRWTADDRERMRPGVERQTANEPRARDTRNGADPFEQLLVERVDLRGEEGQVERRLVER